MSHTYLIDLYNLIDQRLEDVAQESSRVDVDDASFQKGRSKILREFKLFLAEHYNRKLPRRLKNRYAEF